jgi:hypothetical protein
MRAGCARLLLAALLLRHLEYVVGLKLDVQGQRRPYLGSIHGQQLATSLGNATALSLGDATDLLYTTDISLNGM